MVVHGRRVVKIGRVWCAVAAASCAWAKGVGGEEGREGVSMCESYI